MKKSYTSKTDWIDGRKILVSLFFLLAGIVSINAQGTILEAEYGTLIEDASVESTADGYSGTGYVTNFLDNTNSAVVVTYNSDAAGEYTISLGYSSPFGNKDNIVSINGIYVDTVHFDEIHEFTELIVGDFTLQEGENTIGFHTYWGWCYLDYFKVSDIAPRGDFTVDPESPATGDTITFDASACYDPNGTIEAYEWDFDDGATDTGVIVKHVFKNEGIKNVSLVLTDNDDNTSKITHQLSIARTEPYSVFIFSPEYPEPDVPVIFDGTLSYDLSGTVDAYNWDFGDGTTATGVTPSHTYASEGNYEVSLTVTNNRGKTDTRKTTLYVYNSDRILRGPSVLTSLPKTNEKIELAFDVKADYSNPFDPAEVMVDAIIAPQGTTDSIVVPCFYYGNAHFRHGAWQLDSTITGWRARISVEEAGTYQGKLRYTGESISYSQSFSFTASEGMEKGIIHNDANNPQYYRHTTGEPYYPLGINIAWGKLENYESTLENITSFGANFFRYWHTPFEQKALEWWDNGFYGGLAQYNQQAAAMTDSLLGLGKKYGAYMQLTMFQHGPFSETVNAIWNENPYNTANGGFVESADDFFSDPQCKFYIKKLLRYIVARWGYSPNIFAWEFFNEVQFSGNFPNQSDGWYDGVMEWHSEMSEYVASIDPYNHIRTTSASHEQLYDLDTVSNLDVIQYHLYHTDLVAEQKNDDYTFKKDLQTPIINGEYGEDVETADVPLNKQQISLWNSIFTEVPHIMWLWDNYDKPQWGNVFNYPNMYLQGEDFATVNNLEPAFLTALAEKEIIESTFLKADSAVYGLVYDVDGGLLENVKVDSITLPFGNYDIEYYLSGSDEIILKEDVPFIRTYNSINIPNAANDVALKIKYSSFYGNPIAIAGDDKLVALGTDVLLDGSGSIDPLGNSLNYNWQLIEKPASSSLTIEDGFMESVTISPDVSGSYTFSLTVDNGSLFAIPDTVIIVSSSMPIANAGPDILVQPRKPGMLDGSDSYDPDGEEITYLWQIISGPEGAAAEILKYNEDSAYFRGDLLGEYLVTLAVDDGIQPSLPDTVKVTVTENVGVQTTNANQVKLYPNPATDYLKIRITNCNEALKSYKILDISGRTIKYEFVENYNTDENIEIKIDLTSMNKMGLYLIQFSFENSVIVKPFTIY